MALAVVLLISPFLRRAKLYEPSEVKHHAVAIHAQRLGVYRLSLTAIVAMILVLFASTIWLRGPQGKPLSSVAITAFGVMYAGLFSYVYALRYHDYAIGAGAGTALVVLPVILTWATDVGAYMFGRTFGKKKLIPSISPGKTASSLPAS